MCFYFGHANYKRIETLYQKKFSILLPINLKADFKLFRFVRLTGS